MCLAIPGQIIGPADAAGQFAIVEVSGVRRRVNVDLLREEPPMPGEWVLIHVGFAMTKISAAYAAEQLRVLAMLGEDVEAMVELDRHTPD